MKLFRGQNLIEFSKRFKTDEDCNECLAKIRWEKGYACVILNEIRFAKNHTPISTKLVQGFILA